MTSSVVYVTALDLNGLPNDPPEARKVFKRACGFQVRDNASITIQDWQLMSMTTRDQLWSNIKKKIKFPDGVDEELVKSVTFIHMEQLIHRRKSYLNRKYVKKQLVPKQMGKIT
jgi:hypothetical protein